MEPNTGGGAGTPRRAPPLPMPRGCGDAESLLRAEGDSREYEFLIDARANGAPGPLLGAATVRQRLPGGPVCASLSLAAALCLAALAFGLVAPRGRAVAVRRVLGLQDVTVGKPSHAFSQALQATEQKTKEEPAPAPAHFDVFLEPSPWHENDLEDEAVKRRMSAEAYRGRDGMWCVGINLLGFSLDAPRGRYGRYAGPSLSDVRYFHHAGANCFRLAVTWERLQSKLGAEDLDPVPGIDEIVELITAELGGHVIMDPHNGEFGLQHNGLNVVRSDFSKLWAAIAKKWGRNDKVIFGLYNEPHGGFESGVERYFDRDAEDSDGSMVEFWRQWAQAAIDAIRGTGAGNLILVPGLHRSNSADWSGAHRWGESLADSDHAGNSRLAALRDPAQHLAYDVHQHMDPTFTGARAGCAGHAARASCRGEAGCSGADEGLEQTIAWARRYSKRLMMTELSSIPDANATGAGACATRLSGFLQRMNESGVFIGYQAWQSGCEFCPGDLTPRRPGNLDWYRLHDFGRPCSEDLEDCRSTRCCRNPASRCYEKDAGWAACKPECKRGIDRSEEKKYRTNWTCAVVAYAAPVCSDETDDCSKTRCCNDPSRQCYKKEDGWAVCRTTCVAGELWDKDDPAHQIPWNCTLLSRSTRIQLK
uniref:Glycoside hydrolase family 5 domain-containing protein n=1 Tax=Alexandrium monilatum TaxID=311494 RepID=A0A7S4UQ72_9DINO